MIQIYIQELFYSFADAYVHFQFVVQLHRATFLYTCSIYYLENYKLDVLFNQSEKDFSFYSKI